LPKQTNSQPPVHAYSNATTYPLKPQLRTPHVELPSFTGDNPRAWILETEDIFRLVGINGEARVRWGLAHIHGQAKIWISSSGLDLQQISWAELCTILLDRFPDAVTIDPMEQLHN